MIEEPLRSGGHRRPGEKINAFSRVIAVPRRSWPGWGCTARRSSTPAQRELGRVPWAQAPCVLVLRLGLRRGGRSSSLKFIPVVEVYLAIVVDNLGGRRLMWSRIPGSGTPVTMYRRSSVQRSPLRDPRRRSRGVRAILPPPLMPGNHVRSLRLQRV